MTTFHPDVVAVLAVAVAQVVGDQFDRFGAVGGNAGIEKEAANSSRSAIFFIWVTGVINLCKGSNIFRKANRFSGWQNPFQAVETLGQQFARAGDVQADESFARRAVDRPGVDVQAAFVQQPSG